jgi:hypothetical protein
MFEKRMYALMYAIPTVKLKKSIPDKSFTVKK